LPTTLAFLLNPSVKHRRVESTVSELWDAHQRTEYGLCLGLRRLYRDQVHRRKGRARFVDWAEQRFGIPRKLAGTFSWIGSVIEKLPLTMAAMERGEVTYTKVREFMTQATPETEAEWIGFAKTHTNREIEARVRRREAKDGTEKVKATVELTPEERQATRKAREILQKETGEPVREAEVLGKLATSFVENGGLFGGGGDGGDGDAAGRPKKRSAYVSFQPCPICLDSFVPVPEGLLRVPPREWIEAIRDGAEAFDLMDHFFCDCHGEKHRKDRCPNWRFPEARPAESRHIPSSVEKRIHARDGFVCRTPGCGCALPLEMSHLTPFRDGTPPVLEHLRQHCATCNDLIETGRLRVSGHAPYERYYSADGEFLGFGYSRSRPHVGTGREWDGVARKAAPEAPEPVPIGPGRG